MNAFGRYVKVSWTSNWGSWLVGMATIHILGPDGAKWNTEVMPHTYNGSLVNGTAEEMSNTNTNDYWQLTAGSMPHWWKVDLGAIREISKIRTQAYYGDYQRNFKDFIVSISDDDITYTEILIAQTLGNASPQDFVIDIPSPEYNAEIDTSLDGVSGDLSMEFVPPRFVEMDTSLDGVSGNFDVTQELKYENIQVSFDVVRSVFEDIGVINEWQKMSWKLTYIVFQVNAPNTYNFNDVLVWFEVQRGDRIEDVPIIFSITKSVQSFLSYIMQKLYITCSEIVGSYHDLELQDWNVKPNKTWYVRVTNGSVFLYDTQADMEADINPVASGVADSDLHVVLYSEDEYDADAVEFYYQDLLYHLSLSEIIGDEYGEYDAPTRYFKVKPLTDLSEIRHPIYNNSNVVLTRGEAELDLHTFCSLNKELVLGTHLPTLESGDVISYVSTRRGFTEKSQVLTQTIAGNIDSLVTTIRVATYIELVRR